MLNQNPSKREANPNQNGKQNPTPSSSISLKKEKELKEAAERIWQTYPKKDGKQEGIKAILKRLREGLGEEYLLERVRVYCVCYSGKDKGYVKNAQGWFKQSRYLDASLDDPAPPRDISSLGLEDFRLAYRKVHEGDFSVDFCPEMGKAKAILSADYDALLRDYKAEYNNITARFNAPFSKLKVYIQKIKKEKIYE